MEYQALYRKYRPTNFDEISGQQVTLKILKNAIKNNKIGHAYLFFGPRGTGKTSMAKIISRTINCLQLEGKTIPCEKCKMCIASKEKECVDILEIDAASNNGVDEIRELKNKVNLVPAELKYKVYIIDEVHMLSIGAFNALLKTLEEPPKHVIFILATTELNKVPATIVSRCQTLEFKKILSQDMFDRIKSICNEEKIEISNEAIEEIVQNSDGGLRDALGLLEKLNSYTNSKISEEDVRNLTGNITKKELDEFIEHIIKKNIDEIIRKINEFEVNGVDLVKVINDLIKKLRNEIVIKKNKSILPLLEQLILTEEKMKNSNNSKILLELCFLNNINDELKENEMNIQNEEIKENFNGIEQKIYKEKQINDNSYDLKIKKMKNIRVNNTFACANKNIITMIRNNWNNMKNEAFNTEYGSLARILAEDARPVAASEEYIILTFKTEGLERQCNNNLEKIEKAIYNVFNTHYKTIALTEKEWSIYIQEYKENKNNYHYIKEELEKEKENTEDKSLIEKAKELFGDIDL